MLCEVRLGMAWRGVVRQGMARLGEAGQGMVRQGMARNQQQTEEKCCSPLAVTWRNGVCCTST